MRLVRVPLFYAQVKTTAPKRYLVKPNQGVVAPGQTDRIQIQIVPKERTYGDSHMGVFIIFKLLISKNTFMQSSLKARVRVQVSNGISISKSCPKQRLESMGDNRSRMLPADR